MSYVKILEKLEITVENLKEIVYDLLALEPNALDNPIVEAYEKIKTYRENMLSERQHRFNTPNLRDLPSNWWLNPDKNLVTWYEQERLGVPEEQRVVLNPDQQQIVHLNKKLDAEAEKYSAENKDKSHKDHFGPGMAVLASIYLVLNPEFAHLSE